MTFNPNEHSFYSVIPSAILFNKNIEPNCVKLYAIILSLSKMHGYCFATNAYLAAALECDGRSISRWVSSLIKEGYLEMRVVNRETSSQRYLYLSEKFKKYLPVDKIVHPPRQNCLP